MKRKGRLVSIWRSCSIYGYRERCKITFKLLIASCLIRCECKKLYLWQWHNKIIDPLTRRLKARLFIRGWNNAQWLNATLWQMIPVATEFRLTIGKSYTTKEQPGLNTISYQNSYCEMLYLYDFIIQRCVRIYTLKTAGEGQPKCRLDLST